MTLKRVMQLCPSLPKCMAKDVLEAAKLEADPVTDEVILRLAQEMYD